MQMDIKDEFGLLCVSFSISENVYFCLIYIFVSAAFDSLAPQQNDILPDLWMWDCSLY